MRSKILARVAVALSLCIAGQRATMAQDGFQPMFTDAALSGWVRTNTPEETWRMEDGVLY